MLSDELIPESHEKQRCDTGQDETLAWNVSMKLVFHVIMKITVSGAWHQVTWLINSKITEQPVASIFKEKEEESSHLSCRRTHQSHLICWYVNIVLLDITSQLIIFGNYIYFWHLGLVNSV